MEPSKKRQRITRGDDDDLPTIYDDDDAGDEQKVFYVNGRVVDLLAVTALNRFDVPLRLEDQSPFSLQPQVHAARAFVYMIKAGEASVDIIKALQLADLNTKYYRGPVSKASAGHIVRWLDAVVYTARLAQANQDAIKIRDPKLEIWRAQLTQVTTVIIEQCTFATKLILALAGKTQIDVENKQDKE